MTTERFGPYVKVASGRRIYLSDVQPGDWKLEDIAMSLAHLPRFSGNIGPYYVAQHCMHVSAMARDQGRPAKEQLKALLHEADEVVTGDVPSPVKWMDQDYIDRVLRSFVDHIVGHGDLDEHKALYYRSVIAPVGFLKELGRKLRNEGAFPAFGLKPGVPSWLKYLDNVAFATERRDFHFDDTVCMSFGDQRKDEVDPDPSRVLEFSDPHLAYQRFVRRARQLLQEIAFGR